MARTAIPWFRVGVEFLVIFAGITLSLLADDWRQERGERALEDIALREIAADLAADMSELEGLQRSSARHDSEANKPIAII